VERVETTAIKLTLLLLLVFPPFLSFFLFFLHALYFQLWKLHGLDVGVAPCRAVPLTRSGIRLRIAHHSHSVPRHSASEMPSRDCGRLTEIMPPTIKSRQTRYALDFWYLRRRDQTKWDKSARGWNTPRVITLAGAKVNDTTDTCCGEHVSVSESLTRRLPAPGFTRDGIMKHFSLSLSLFLPVFPSCQPRAIKFIHNIV